MPVYRGDGPWGFGKGAPLTSSEGDGNIFELLARIAALESATGVNPIAGVSASTNGTQLTFLFVDGTTASVAMPLLTFRWRDDWAPTTVYQPLDTFRVAQVGLYLVLLAHTSDSTFDESAVDIDSNPLYFKLFGFSNNTARYITGPYVPGLLAANQNLLFWRFTTPTTIPADFAPFLGHFSQAGGSVPATADTVIIMAKAASSSPTSFSNVGTITIGAGTVNPIFSTSGSPVLFATGDIMRLRAPASPDAAFADFHCAIVGHETS